MIESIEAMEWISAPSCGTRRPQQSVGAVVYREEASDSLGLPLEFRRILDKDLDPFRLWGQKLRL